MNENLLTESEEYLKLPKNVVSFIGLRSTFSRLGLNTPPTMIDPGLEGKIISHLIGGSFPIRLNARTPVFKVMFFYCIETRGYNGKYKGQKGIVVPKLPINSNGTYHIE
ncbi:MAG: hypothetical protein QXO03_01345 [Thermoplasmatales archaeon]